MKIISESFIQSFSDIEKSIDKCLIDKILPLNATYSEFKANLEALIYLETLDEAAIYSCYEEAIKKDHQRPFDGFTQEHRDAYLRLKFKALGSPSVANQPKLVEKIDTQGNYEELKTMIEKLEAYKVD